MIISTDWQLALYITLNYGMNYPRICIYINDIQKNWTYIRMFYGGTSMTEENGVCNLVMKASWDGNVFRITGLLWVETTDHWWITASRVMGSYDV